VLDACRDNPFAWARSGSRGLTVLSGAPTGSIVMYATSANAVAEDGTGRNGVFTGQLLGNLKTQGISVLDVLNRTMRDVLQVSNGRQYPELFLRYPYADRIYLGPQPVQPAPAVVTPQPAPTPAPTPPTPTVTGVTITPFSSVTVNQGATRQFTASVTGTNNPPQTVRWSVTGVINGTSISQNGLLTVASNQTPGYLSVTATSTTDTTKYGTVTVFVPTPATTTQSTTTPTVTSDPIPPGLEYSTAGNNVTITKYTGTASTLTIPSQIQNMAVTAIADNAFFGCTSLTSISLPSSIRTIGNSAFQNCSNLRSITLPSSITSIGGWAFQNCTSLDSITLPSSLTSIGNWAFFNCVSLTSMTIPASVRTIGDSAFSGCNNLTSVTISRSTQIGRNAFPGSVRFTYR